MTEEMLLKLAQAVVDGNPEVAEKMVSEALVQGVDPLICLNKGLTVGIARVGELFAIGDYYLPDLIAGAMAMKAALSVLEPALVKAGRERKVLGRVVLGTVKGDQHDIGKTLVGIMLTANGFLVTDIGVDKPVADFVSAAKDTNATLVGASALLTTTMLQQQHIVQEFEKAGLRPKVKVIVGGAPVTKSWAEKINADGFAEDAVAAVALAKMLLGHQT